MIDVPVTRQSSTKIGTETSSTVASSASELSNVVDISTRAEWRPYQPTKVQMVGFTDWLSIYQRHFRTESHRLPWRLNS